MKKLFVLLIAVCALGSMGIAQVPMTTYVLASVPESIRKDAEVVKRYENLSFEVTDIDRAVYKVHRVYTVFSNKGKYALSFAENTDKFCQLGDVDIKVYDAFGKAVQKYKRKDLSSYAASDGLIDDDKVFYINLPVSSYPVTVEYEYELKYKGTLFYPNYSILIPGQGLEVSSFTAKVPKDLDLRYKLKSIDVKPEVIEEAKYKIYKWTVKNLAPIKFEPGALGRSEYFPAVLLAPTKFKMDDYEGDMSSWQAFGRWYATMKKGIDVLPENKKAFFRQLVQNAKDDREKTRIIYEYLQKNFRYVGIQLGIGGYRPFPAAFTDDKKYGDCKGLSNFVQAALDAVNIRSYQALIYREPNAVPLDKNFPVNKFNHVILMVPDKKDTIWLECTSKTLDFGKLDISTQNRNALVISDDGGVLVLTPVSHAEDNTLATTTTIDLQENGEGTTTTTFVSEGYFKEYINEVLTGKKDDQKETLVQYWHIKQPDVFTFTKNEKESSKASLQAQIEKVPEFISGNKMFISPRFLKYWDEKLPSTEERKQDLFIGPPFQQTDTTIIKMPAGFVVDALPKEKQLNTPFTTYTTRCWYDEEQKAVYSTARLVVKQHNIPAASYAEVKKFFDDLLLEDAQKIVIKKQ